MRSPHKSEAEYKEILTAIGRVAVSISTLEGIVSNLLVALVGKKSVYDVTLSSLNFGRRLDILKELAAAELADQIIRERVQAFASECKRLNSQRNEFVHAAYEMNPDEGLVTRTFKNVRDQEVQATEILILHDEIVDAWFEGLTFAEIVNEALGRPYRKGVVLDFRDNPGD